MEDISYITGLFWFLLWPIVIFVSYRFIVTNIAFMEENLEKKD